MSVWILHTSLNRIPFRCLIIAPLLDPRSSWKRFCCWRTEQQWGSTNSETCWWLDWSQTASEHLQSYTEILGDQFNISLKVLDLIWSPSCFYSRFNTKSVKGTVSQNLRGLISDNHKSDARLCRLMGKGGKEKTFQRLVSSVHWWTDRC